MTALRVYTTEAAIGTAPAVLVHRASANSVPPTVAAVIVHRLSAFATGAADLGDPVLGIEPWAQVTLTATSPGVPTSWVWRQVSGTPVTLSGTGSARTYSAPAPLDTTTLVFAAKAVFADGSETAEGTVTHEVLWVTERAIINGVEVPIQVLAVVTP